MQRSSLNRMLIVGLLAAAVLLTTAPRASASGVTCREGPPQCLNGTGHFDWTQNYGPPFSTIPNNSVVLGGSGFAQVSFAQGGDGERVDQGNGWNGNFKNGDELLWTNSPGQGPLTITFLGGGERVTRVGANIQTDSFGPFTALIQAFDPNGFLMDSFSEDGNSNGNGNNSAIFIGLEEDGDIGSVTFSITSCVADCNDFAINQLDIVSHCECGVPEPASLFLFGTGLLGLGGSLRGRRKPMPE